MKALLATKIGMTQLFSEKGRSTAVTILQAGPCVITQLKDDATDGYTAVQLGFGDAKHQPKPQAGHLKKAKTNSRYMAEFRLPADATEGMALGDSITVEAFSVGESITVSALSKGKGFAGTIKRHNFSRGPKTHGSHNYRAPGSIGAGYPEHVFKGQKMGGRMGHDKVSVRNLKIALVDAKNNLIAVTGAVPGPKKGLVRLSGDMSVVAATAGDQQ